MKQMHLNAIRAFEGYSPVAKWDYKQASIGYGTRARFVGEVIDRAEAERRFEEEIGEARALVQRFAPNLDEGTVAALTSLTFNAGTSWMRSGLGAAVKAGDLDSARSIFKQYTYAGGQSLPGLVARREAEARWFGLSGEEGRPSAGLAAEIDTQPAIVGGPTVNRFEAIAARLTANHRVTEPAGAEQALVQAEHPRGADQIASTAFSLHALIAALVAFYTRTEVTRTDDLPQSRPGEKSTA